MIYEFITRKQFVDTPQHPKLDAFARTFISKADMLKLWDKVYGVLDDDGLVCAAICVRGSKRLPLTANLQLLHTFAAHRRKGLARAITLEAYRRLYQHGSAYFRVSSEPEAADFYRSLGLKFWGYQKSGCLLCLHKVMSANPKDGKYDWMDVWVQAGANSGRRGSLVTHFGEPW